MSDGGRWSSVPPECHSGLGGSDTPIERKILHRNWSILRSGSRRKFSWEDQFCVLAQSSQEILDPISFSCLVFGLSATAPNSHSSSLLACPWSHSPLSGHSDHTYLVLESFLAVRSNSFPCGSSSYVQFWDRIPLSIHRSSLFRKTRHQQLIVKASMPLRAMCRGVSTGRV